MCAVDLVAGWAQEAAPSHGRCHTCQLRWLSTSLALLVQGCAKGVPEAGVTGRCPGHRLGRSGTQPLDHIQTLVLELASPD